MDGWAAGDFHGDRLKYRTGGAGGVEEPDKFAQPVCRYFRRGLLEGGAFAGGRSGLNLEGGLGAVGELKRDRQGLPGDEAGELEIGFHKPDGLAGGGKAADDQKRGQQEEDSFW